MKDNILKDGFQFDLETQSTNYQTYEIPSMNKCEFIGYTFNNYSLLCKTSEQTVDVLDPQTLKVVGRLDTE